ncbi:MAG: pilus assembly protein PilM [Chloroflexota bacterium]
MSRAQVTLNIGASAIKLLSVKGRDVEKWTSMPLPFGLVRDGLILQPKVVGSVINDLFKSAGVSKDSVVISVTGLPFTYRFISLPRMKPEQQQEALLRAARKEMELPFEQLYLSWQAVIKRSDEQDFFVLGVPRKPVDAVIQTMEEAGIKNFDMDIKPLSLARAANQGNAIIVELAPDCYDIVLVAQDIVSMMHTVIPKREEPVEYNIQRLADELSKIVEFYNAGHSQNPLSPTTPLLVTGELLTGTKTFELIQTTTGYSVEPLVPPYKLPDDLPVAAFASNIGLALKKASLKAALKRHNRPYIDININVLSERARVKTSGAIAKNILIVLALLIGVGLIYPVYQLSGQAHLETARLDTELTKVRQELDRRLQVNSEAQQTEKKIAEIIARNESIIEENNVFLNKGTDFASDLELVTGILPAGAVFTSVRVTDTQMFFQGKADGYATLISYALALEKLFSDVRIDWIDDSIIQTANNTPVFSGISFNIVIDK